MGQALFSNQRETNLASTIALVEEVLAELRHPAPASRVTDPTVLHAWQLTHGSAKAQVALVARTEFTHIRVTATVMTMSTTVDRLELFGHLLGLNAELCGAAFAADGDRVLLVAERSTLDLDRSEIVELIRRVTTYADDHDDVLVARFGGTLGAAT
jgi:hypothetical protein